MRHNKQVDNFIIFWLVGEKSGDIHSAQVMKKLNESLPNIEHIGIGGPLMQNNGLKQVFPFEKFSVMGFVEVIKHIFFFLGVEKRIKRIFMEEDKNFPVKPDLLVLVDYPGLNLRIAKIAQYLNIKVLYYICPQFWAWKHRRVYQLEKYCDEIACILPFEKDLLDIHRIESYFVGHPVIEEIKFELNKDEFAEFFKIDVNKKWISFFPGSRENEVKKLLPVYLKTILKLKEIKPDYHFLISKSNSICHNHFMSYFKNNPKYKNLLNKSVTLIDGYNYELMKYSDFMIIKSGTSTLEAAIIGTPFIITYIANKISYLLAKKIIKIKFIGLPNIILNEDTKLDSPVIPELIQDDVNPDKIISMISNFMDNVENYDLIKKKISKISTLLGEQSASANVSKLITDLLSERLYD